MISIGYSYPFEGEVVIMQCKVGLLFFSLFQICLALASDPDKISTDQLQLPIHFEANRGQADPDVEYVARARGYTVLLGGNSARFLFHNSGEELRIGLEGARRKPVIRGMSETGARVHYYIGNDPAKWHGDVPTYGVVIYKDVYPGIDWVFYETDGLLEYDFVVAPGSDPAQIRMSLNGTNQITIEKTGDLISGSFRMLVPYVYQEGQRIGAKYTLTAHNKICFALGSYDLEKPLVIDPKISFGTLIGGPTFDNATNIALDNKGNFYVVGYTEMNTRIPGYGKALIYKFNSAGRLVWSTLLGGSGGDGASGVAVTPGGIVYVVGGTGSRDFPIVGAFQSTYGGNGDAFIAKLSANGSLIRSSYHGGSGRDNARDVKLGTGKLFLNELYVIGNTESRNFPRKSATQNQFRAPSDGFLTILNTLNFTRELSTYVGINGRDDITSLAFNATRGDLYITALNPGVAGGYVAHFKPVSRTTDLSQKGIIRRMETNRILTRVPGYTLGQAYSKYVINVFGADIPTFSKSRQVSTKSPQNYIALVGDFCLFQAPATSCSEGQTVLFFDQDLNFQSLTTIGGPGAGSFYVNDMASRGGRLYLVGETLSRNLPVITPFQATNKGGYDGFIITMAPGGNILFSSYLGGIGHEFISGVAVSAAGNIHLVGQTSTKKFPTTPNAIKRTLGGTADAFVVKVTP